ncbi:hypothetical protein VTI28DRAFT_506 [Corynascus sepedonium]
MPTTHVDPGCDPLLQDIANTLWKSRKVVVITGAGISTNSGIPDFRSENGLYSLIQAQFDATQQQSIDINNEACPPDAIEQRPPKRQRRAYEDSGHERGQAFEDNGLPFPGLRSAATKTDGAGNGPNTSSEKTQAHAGGIDSQPRQNTEQMHAAENNPAPPSATRLSDSRADNHLNAEENTGGGGPCPSSPPSFALGTPHHRRAHLLETLPGSSSPLSSPPPITYDPYQETSSCSSDRDTESSRSQSEEPSSVTTPLLSSQTSISSRSSLPLMKGRDLFDAQIWSCPVKTSVFYTFVSTLREKVRCAEPTISHRFVGVLRDSRKLVRCYTQNIDQLEERVGLRTSLSLGPGSRYRFSARAGRNSGVARNSTKGVDDPPASQGDSHKDEDQKPSRTQTDSDNTQDEATSSTPSASQPTAPASPNRGVECVFLHGSLAELRCFVCARTASWEEDTRLADTLAGRQPTCPHCAGATAAREERGKRALGVGKLRPDIVLYGEEHPHAHLISPLVQHDLSLGPDMLLILGTSLRVHGLKVLVREFAKAVHDRGGKVVFVNFTKPPESVWADIIDYWVQWDCDAWVGDLQARKPALWLPPGATLPEEEKPKTAKASRRQSAAEPSKRKEKPEKTTKKKRDSDGPVSDQKADSERILKDTQEPAQESQEDMPPFPRDVVSKKAVKAPKEPKLNPEAKRPASVRDHKLNGAYLVGKIVKDLHRITGDGPAKFVASPPSATATKPKGKRPRKSAPAALGFGDAPTDQSAPEAPRTPSQGQEAIIQSFPVSNAQPKNDFMSDGTSSISAAVKSRKRKQTVAWRMIGGVETRVSLDDAGAPQSPAASLPRPTTILQPSPVPDSRRLPLPTPTAHQPTPQYQTYHGHIPPSRSVGASPQVSAIDMAINAGFRETDRLIAQIHHETLLSRPATPLQLHLPPLLVTNLQNQQRHQRVQPTNPGQQQHKHEDQQQHKAVNTQSDRAEPWQQQTKQAQPRQQCRFYSTTKLVPLEPKVDSPGPRQEISSNVGSPVRCGSGGASGPFFFSDPLSSWLGYPPVWLQQQQLHDHHHDDHHHRRRQEPVLGPPQRQQQQQRMNYEKDGYSKRKVGLKCLSDTDQRSDAKWEPQREGEAGVSSPWCPDEQLWKEQEAALMLSTMRGTG